MTLLTRRAALVSLLASALWLPRAHGARSDGAAAGLLLVDTTLSLADLTCAPGMSGTRQRLAIERDLVRQWRDGLQSVVQMQHGSVTALVRWDKALVLSGLAREEGLRASLTRLSRSVFRVDLTA